MADTSQTILILGAGGAGVSNIAQIYRERGFTVIGVDRQVNAATENLQALGITVYTEVEAIEKSLGSQVDLVFRSSAVPDTNPLVIQAREAGVEVIGRHEFFADVSRKREIIAVAGSSGKTSTTGIVAHIFSGHEDSGFLVGIHGKGGHWGSAERFIIEADEYAKTFLSLEQIQTALITNLSYDHVDIYLTQADYDEAFRTFATTAHTSGGKVIIFGDNPHLREVVTDIPYISYGRDESNDWTAREIENFEGGSRFAVYHKNDRIAEVTLQVIGGHNVINALAGFVVAYENDIPVETIVSRLANFTGLPRRLELLRREPYFVYDDYAHLPGEIDTVLRGVRESFPNRRILCYWQPHTYARANHFFHQYAQAVSQSDLFFLADVYAARDEGSFDYQGFLAEVTSEHSFHSGEVEPSRQLIEEHLQEGDVLICLNAGTGTQIAHYFAQK